MLRTLWRVSGTHCTATGRFRWVPVGLMGVTNDSTDYNYGWYNLDDAFIKGIPGGFRLILPHTVPLR
mgnify:CR=1 FL=1